MRILFLGDVVGRSGRDAVLAHVPQLRKDLQLDAIIANGDNAAAGFGITSDICKQFFDAGVDVITGGDHIWDQKEIPAYIAQEKRLLRPANFPAKTSGFGAGIYTTSTGKRLAVIHLLGQVFHKEHLDCPFAAVDALLERIRLIHEADAIVVDVHAEATSEKTAFGAYLNGKVSLVVGSHTHIPTSDARILSLGTGYQTDAGMCGDYDSVIGFNKDAPLARFTTKVKKHRLEPATNAATLCGVFIETNDKNGLCTHISPIQLGGTLPQIAITTQN